MRVAQMTPRLRVLILEDGSSDAELMAAALQQRGEALRGPVLRACAAILRGQPPDDQPLPSLPETRVTLASEEVDAWAAAAGVVMIPIEARCSLTVAPRRSSGWMT